MLRRVWIEDDATGSASMVEEMWRLLPHESPSWQTVDHEF